MAPACAAFGAEQAGGGRPPGVLSSWTILTNLTMEIGQSKVTDKGQVTIPQEIRNRKRILPGTSVFFVEIGDTLVVKTAHEIQDLFREVHDEVRRLGITREETEEAVRKERRKTLKRLHAKGPR